MWQEGRLGLFSVKAARAVSAVGAQFDAFYSDD
jgi:hypothetical protein